MGSPVPPGATRTAAIVLAAGSSRRFGRHKLVVALEGRPLLQHVIDAANASSVDDVVLVLGHRPADVLAAVRLGRARATVNAAYDEGQSTSLRRGVSAAATSDAVVILLGDQPRVSAHLIDAVLERHRRSGAPAVICAWDGRRSPPTLLHRSLWPRLEALSGDVGAREILAGCDPVAVVEVTPDLGSLDDVDRPADLERVARAT